MAILCFLGMAAAVWLQESNPAKTVSGSNTVVKKEKICVVVDPGHGGFDPGKIGINGVQEKDVNLSIAKRVQEYLEANDIEVVMTREEDEDLSQGEGSHKKVRDMKNRIALIEQASAVLAVSIHQNSYPQEYVRGAQVFYHGSSKEGEQLAKILQEQIVKKADRENKRQIKANNSYYLLKKTGVPIVIVECGFLSNKEEAQKLSSSRYQDRMAWAIAMGIQVYLSR